MLELINQIEARILGSLVEKQLTTPEYYPLTLTALVNACNQKSSRDPVVSYSETTVTDALEGLRDRNLVYVFYGSTSRVPKYKHMLPSVFELDPAETAVVTVLLLRGPQTLGEIRTRTERLFDFESLGKVQETLDGLMRRDDPLVTKLPVLAGQKEARFAHLLCGEIDVDAIAATVVAQRTHGSVEAERLQKLEEELKLLSEEFSAFREMFEEFRKQFE